MTKLAILGANEFAKMLAQSASVLNIPVRIISAHANAPALAFASDVQIVSWSDVDAVQTALEGCTHITLMTTDVPLETLRALQDVQLTPSLPTLEAFYDRIQQRRRIEKQWDVPRFRQVSVGTDILDAAQEFGFPLILKPRHGDIGAQERILIQRAHDIQPALERLSNRGALMVEGVVPFLRELSVVIVRRVDGDNRTYPVTEIVRREQHLFTVRCPASIDEASAVRAVEMARQIVEEVEGVGTFTVHLYEVENNDVIFDELIPQPHTSGHYTVEGVITSQYENHLRALLGLPLGDVFQIAPATATVNIIAEQSGVPNDNPIQEALATEGAHIHIYGKPTLAKGESAGHITVLGYNTDGAEKVARLALSRIKL
jgi:5-(carboxyamino)imidazole ribonucleotide synthase